MNGRDPNQDRVPVGGSLHLADARFLRHELRKLGIRSAVRRDPASVPGQEGTHVVLVKESDLESAELARNELLDETEEATSGTPSAAPWRGFPPGPLVLGLFGAVVGLRVGSRLHGPPWITPLVMTSFVAVATGLGFLLRRASLPESSCDDGEDDGHDEEAETGERQSPPPAGEPPP